MTGALPSSSLNREAFPPLLLFQAYRQLMLVWKQNWMQHDKCWNLMGNVCSLPYLQLSFDMLNTFTSMFMKRDFSSTFMWFWSTEPQTIPMFPCFIPGRKRHKSLEMNLAPLAMVWWPVWGGGFLLSLCSFLVIYCWPISKSWHWLDHGYNCCVLV